MPAKLDGKVAVVTGSSRGIGRGIAIGLGERGATVYVSGRTTSGELSIGAAADAVTRAGGRGIAVVCDHGDDNAIGRLFAYVQAGSGHIDILVNNVYKIPDPPAWSGGFWEHPISVWDDQVGIGLRSHYVASWYAAPLLFAATKPALIVNVSSPGGQSYRYSSSYGAGKAGLDRLTSDIAHELAAHEVAAIALYPGSVATEFVVEQAALRGTDLSTAQTPLFVGRAVAAMATAPDVMARSGSVQWVEDLASEFNVVDEQGHRPPGYRRRGPA